MENKFAERQHFGQHPPRIIRHYSAGLRAGGFAPIKMILQAEQMHQSAASRPFLSPQKVIIAGVIEIKGRGGGSTSMRLERRINNKHHFEFHHLLFFLAPHSSSTRPGPREIDPCVLFSLSPKNKKTKTRGWGEEQREEILADVMQGILASEAVDVPPPLPRPFGRTPTHRRLLFAHLNARRSKSPPFPAATCSFHLLFLVCL